jgi:hypothetical protein
VSLAVGVNLVLFGLMAPFAATVANRWFVRRRGLVMGVLTAASATGQLVFLPVVAWMTERSGWRAASLAVIPLVQLRLRDGPAELGVAPYGAPTDPPMDGPGADPPADHPADPPVDTRRLPSRPSATLPVRGPRSTVGRGFERGQVRGSSHGTDGRSNRGIDGDHGPQGPARRALTTLAVAARTRTFWALAVGFAICGTSTNGLIATHFIPSAHDHGMPETTAAGLLMLPALLSDSLHPSIIVFVVVYGLDWVATVPPTAALCREAFGEAGSVVFGWVFAAHQIGAAVVSVGAGVIRDTTGQYTMAWVGAACLCLVAAFASTRVGRTGEPVSP